MRQQLYNLLSNDFSFFESVTKTLVRFALDQVISRYSVMAEYLDVDSHLVKNSDFENGFVKILDKKENAITVGECNAVKMLEWMPSICPQPVSTDHDASKDCLENLIQMKKRFLESQSKCQNGTGIHPTSNSCERLFSTSRQVLTGYRLEQQHSSYLKV